ncbi:tubulin binding cofactor C-domain-containing protein [Crassisporium funariophilum]|nr:tubulin binding cofactor C-domain-containing protein [Crassisporium funariophilum]
MDDSNWAFSVSFTPQFQAMRSDLESRIIAAKSPLPDVVQELSVLLAKMTKALADATGSIPSYDQKQYELQLKDLGKSIEALRVSNVPKTKFAFKRKAQAAPVPQSSALPTSQTSKEAITSHPIPEPSSASSNLSLSSHRNKYLTRSSLPEHPEHSDLSISDLDSCIVNLLPATSTTDTATGKDTHLKISALHARNLTNCVLLLPSIDGSALLYDLSHCVIVLGCHQFRMHSSKKTDIFLSISSNPIIEDCHDIRFTQYPDTLNTALGTIEPPFSVQDFSHIRPTASPNFSVMTDEARVDAERWLISARDRPSLMSELSSILPQ